VVLETQAPKAPVAPPAARKPTLLQRPTPSASARAMTCVGGGDTPSPRPGSRPGGSSRPRPPPPATPEQRDASIRNHPALHVSVRTPHALTAVSKSQYPQKRTQLDMRVKKVLLHTPSQFTEWLIQMRLVRAVQYCPIHPVTWAGQPRQLKLGMFTDSDKLAQSGGYVWVKTCCRPKFLSVHFGSLFDVSKLLMPTAKPIVVLKLIYHWSCQTPTNNVTHWLKLQPEVVDLVNGLFRAVCMLKTEETTEKLGKDGGLVQVGLVSLGTAGPDGLNKNVKVEVLGVKDEKSSEIRLVGFEPKIRNRIRAVVGAVQEWVHQEASLMLDHSISPLPFRPHFKHVSNAPAASKDTPGNIMHYLRRNMPRMFQTSLVYLHAPNICQFIAEITWREKFGRDPNAAFTNLLSHTAELTQQTEGSLIAMLKKVLLSPSMDLQRKPRKQVKTEMVSRR